MKTGSWTFGQKLAAGLTLIVTLTLIASTLGVYALRRVVAEKDEVITVHAQSRIEASRMRVRAEHKAASGLAFFLTREAGYLADINTARSQFFEQVRLLKNIDPTPENLQSLARIEAAESANQTALERIILLRKEGTALEVVSHEFKESLAPRYEELDQLLDRFSLEHSARLEAMKRASSEAASSASALVMIITGLTILLTLLIAVMLTRTLGRQIGSAIQHVQSSSTELQATSNQQATAAREQSTAMAEITTTIRELLATSRQIAESAQRVSHIAEDTASAGHAGDETVHRAQESIGSIKRQVDLIVSQMLDLGKKSQRIDGVLEIINELAEQTNILSINASIEAAGVGETGRRFAVVADEIRKLADRVAGSTREIRGLIEEIRSSVHSTIMTTEGGSKAADAGMRQFSDLATSFRKIVDLVGTTTEAAREIELSTKQQATAVAQVDVAVANVAQAARETEAGASQTLQTASELAHLSTDLARLVGSQAQA